MQKRTREHEVGFAPLKCKPASGGVARSVVKCDLSRGSSGGFSKWNFNDERFIARVTDSVGGLIDDFVGAVIKDDFYTIEQRERVSAVNGKFQSLGGTGRICFKYPRRGMINHELIGLEADAQALAPSARSGFGSDESAEINAVGESRGVEDYIRLTSGHSEIGPGGFVFAAN